MTWSSRPKLVVKTILPSTAAAQAREPLGAATGSPTARDEPLRRLRRQARHAAARMRRRTARGRRRRYGRRVPARRGRCADWPHRGRRRAASPARSRFRPRGSARCAAMPVADKLARVDRLVDRRRRCRALPRCRSAPSCAAPTSSGASCSQNTRARNVGAALRAPPTAARSRRRARRKSPDRA